MRLAPKTTTRRFERRLDAGWSGITVDSLRAAEAPETYDPDRRGVDRTFDGGAGPDQSGGPGAG
jgi:hypothetical protein